MRKKVFDMDLASVVALGIGSIVGAGIFALLGQVVMEAGDRTYYSFLIAGITALFSGYSYSRLAAAYPRSGGLTDYFHIAFKSKWISGTLTIIYLLTSAVSISMMAKSFGIYATEFIDYIPPVDNYVNFFATLLIVALAILNMIGAEEVGWTEIFLVSFKFIVLSSLVVSAFWEFDTTALQQLEHTPNISFLGSIGITFFAYAGYGVITNAATDVQNPQQTITQAIYITIILVMMLYMGLAFVVINYIPVAELNANPDTAVATAARHLLGDWGYNIMYLTAVIAFISGISATFFSMFRITRSMAQQKILPHFYMRKFWLHGTYGNMFTSLLIIIATIYFDFNSIVNLASGAYLVSYLAIFAANWKLRRETVSSPAMILSGIGLMLFILVAFVISIVS